MKLNNISCNAKSCQRVKPAYEKGKEKELDIVIKATARSSKLTDLPK